MLSPLTTVLLKIFVKGFYKVHSGLFIAFFVTFGLCFLFVEVLNQTHLPPEQIVRYNLMLVLTIMSSPVMAILIFVAWSGFTVKSWSYVMAQIRLPVNQFLLYSSTSASKTNQFKSWFTVQLVISLPLIGYGIFSLVVGIIFKYYFIPVAIFLYTGIVSAISAWVYMRYVNRPIRVNNRSFAQITIDWHKPFFSLFLYYIFHRLKVPLVITKFISYGVIATSFIWLMDFNNDLNASGLIALGIVAAHSILIYQSYRFEESQLSFSRNLPYSKSKLYWNWAMTYVVLTLPENIWILTQFDLYMGIVLFLFNLSTAMLIRSLLYVVSSGMKKFIYTVFYLVIACFLLILLKLLWLSVILNLLTSIIVFDMTYYRKKDQLAT